MTPLCNEKAYEECTAVSSSLYSNQEFNLFVLPIFINEGTKTTRNRLSVVIYDINI